MPKTRAELEAELEMIDALEAHAAAKAKRINKPTEANIAAYYEATKALQDLRSAQRGDTLTVEA